MDAQFVAVCQWNLVESTFGDTCFGNNSKLDDHFFRHLEGKFVP